MKKIVNPFIITKHSGILKQKTSEAENEWVKVSDISKLHLFIGLESLIMAIKVKTDSYTEIHENL